MMLCISLFKSSSEAEEEDIFVEGAEKPQNEQTHLIKRPRGRPKKQPGDVILRVILCFSVISIMKLSIVIVITS